ncbi:MAG: phenylalanine--tRNA ligase subunit alpha [Thermotogaceae bacterium]|nr:phenylalanine--tRNA ligase subunit alpha [Thermotogaceae bacterium]
MFEDLKNQFFSELSQVSSNEDINNLRIKYLGKKGEVQKLMKKIKEIPPEQRKEYGKHVNELKKEIEEAIKNKMEEIKKLEKQKAFERMWVDVTLPGARRKLGHNHPVMKIWREMEDIFVSLGYEVVEGPDIEDTWHNFDALNTPEWHPARDEHDSFYFDDNHLLRTHTSPVQIRTMLKKKPPLAIISPGRVYRRDYDATHLPVFHQCEGLYVDKRVTVGHLKFTLEEFARRMFGENTEIRLRPSFFPFTEPSFEVDVYLEGYGWLEILGAGMVDPEVFKNVGYDPEEWSGFAFGMGIDRIAMLKYGITDIREFIKNDVRFLRSY